MIWGAKESDLHTKRTGHADFDDRTLEAAKPIELEASHKAAAESAESVGEESVQTEGDYCLIRVFRCCFFLRRLDSVEFWFQMQATNQVNGIPRWNLELILFAGADFG